MKQAFGSFSANALLETAYLTLVITDPPSFEDGGKAPKILGCLCINDNSTLSGDADSFENKIEQLNEYLPVTVLVLMNYNAFKTFAHLYLFLPMTTEK